METFFEVFWEKYVVNKFRGNFPSRSFVRAELERCLIRLENVKVSKSFDSHP